MWGLGVLGSGAVLCLARFHYKPFFFLRGQCTGGAQGLGKVAVATPSVGIEKAPHDRIGRQGEKGSRQQRSNPEECSLCSLSVSKEKIEGEREINSLSARAVAHAYAPP